MCMCQRCLTPKNALWIRCKCSTMVRMKQRIRSVIRFCRRALENIVIGYKAIIGTTKETNYHKAGNMGREPQQQVMAGLSLKCEKHASRRMRRKYVNSASSHVVTCCMNALPSCTMLADTGPASTCAHKEHSVQYSECNRFSFCSSSSAVTAAVLAAS